jgi:ATP-dependent Lhr-like helicase
VACQENTVGPIIPPDHPLVNETIRNCLNEVMDIEGLAEVLGRVERGEIKTVAVETPSPSAMSYEILNANPFAFLDDAPLEERRARAVALRRTDPDLAMGAGALDYAAIEEVRAQARPDIRDPDELHDLLMSIGLLPRGEANEWDEFASELIGTGRATVASWEPDGGPALVAAERIDLIRAAIPTARFDPEIHLPVTINAQTPQEPDGAIRLIVQGWMHTLGPTTSQDLAARLGFATQDVDGAFLALESSGEILRGHFTPGVTELEWCERRLLARIHRLTIGRLRAEIQPVTPAQFVRFLLRWQHVQPGTQLHGRDGVIGIISQLQGLEAPAPAWEEKVLPARIARYDPADLEYLCLSGVVSWGRLSRASDDQEELTGETAPAPLKRLNAPARNSPLAFVMREELPLFIAQRPVLDEPASGLSSPAFEVAKFLESRGATFLTEIVAGTKRMPSEVEDALWELVSAGLVSGDGIAGLRHLLTGAKHARPGSRPRLSALPSARARRRPLPVGRWALWGRDFEAVKSEERNERIARQLLRRYGVIFRDLLAREKNAPTWRVLVNIYRRWEAQGGVRGGRFVGGFVGEQFALPEAVEAMRAVRKLPEETETVIVGAADPLNLAGILLPGPRISPFSGLSIAYQNGSIAQIAPLGTLRGRVSA